MRKGVWWAIGTVVAVLVAILVSRVGMAMAQEVDDDTRIVQERLAEQGCYDGEIDGEFGYATRQAVRCFQRKHGLFVDGVIGEDTRRYLFAEREIEPEERKAPPVVIEREVEPETGDRQALCKPAAIEEIGAARPRKEWAMSVAKQNWARSARFRYGELYADPDNARVVELEAEPCTKSTVGGLITNYRCVFKAFPCRAGS